jgi:hypothetical protein
MRSQLANRDSSTVVAGHLRCLPPTDSTGCTDRCKVNLDNGSRTRSFIASDRCARTGIWLRTAAWEVRGVSPVLLALACLMIGCVIGWVACSWHWHTRLAESWSGLRAATWRRRKRRETLGQERALDVSDVTVAFGYGLVVSDGEADGNRHEQEGTEATR